MPHFTMARTAAFIPALSPPEVRIAIFMLLKESESIKSEDMGRSLRGTPSRWLTVLIEEQRWFTKS